MTKPKAKEYHGMTKTREYRIWQSMKSRCRNKNRVEFKNYGERGISLCERWENFSAFFSDMGKVPKGMTLERIDNNKGYSKHNCKWASRNEQGNNRRCNLNIEIDGKTLTLAQWCSLYGRDYMLVYRRLDSGWDSKRALEIEPIQRQALVEYGGEVMTMKTASEKSGIKYGTLKWRRRLGKPLFSELQKVRA